MNPTFNKQIEQMQKKVQNKEEILEPICIKLKKNVIYWPEAEDVICENAHYVWTQDFQTKRIRPRLVKYLNSYYWMRDGYWLTCLVRIGADSELLILPQTVAHKEVKNFGPEKIEILLKDCSSQTNEDTTLVAQMFCNGQNLKMVPEALLLKGNKIHNFPHTYWNVTTFLTNGADSNHCTGTFEEVDEENYCGREVVKIEKVTLWTGQKILQLFSGKKSYDFDQMLSYWEGFWKTNGY